MVGLDGQLQRERNTWTAPLDFLSKALGPAVGEPVVLRKASRLILVGNVRVPQVGGKVEKTASGARIVLSVQPTTPHKVTREGNKLTVRFDATALDMPPITGFINEFASSAKIDGLSVIFDLGSVGRHVQGGRRPGSRHDRSAAACAGRPAPGAAGSGHAAAGRAGTGAATPGSVVRRHPHDRARSGTRR